MTILKYWNALWDNKISAKEEARQMVKLVMLKNSVLEAIEVHKQYNIAFELEMNAVKAKNNKENAAILLEFAPKYKGYNADFDKKYEDREVKCEILSPC